MFGIIKKIFIVLLTNTVNTSNHKKRVVCLKVIKKARLNLLLLMNTVKNTVKNYTTIYLKIEIR